MAEQSTSDLRLVMATRAVVPGEGAKSKLRLFYGVFF